MLPPAPRRSAHRRSRFPRSAAARTTPSDRPQQAGPARLAWRALALAIVLSPAAIAPMAARPNPAAPPPRPVAPVHDARDPIAAWAEAAGGRQRLSAIHTLYTRYAVKLGGHAGIDAAWTDVRAGAQRESLDVPGELCVLTVCDGRRAWQRGQDGEVVELEGDALSLALLNAGLGSFAPLVPGRRAGAVAALGPDTSGRFDRVRITPRKGFDAVFFLDRRSGLPDHIEIVSGGVTQRTELSDWRDKHGVRFAHSIRQTNGDPNDDATLELEEVAFDRPLPRAAFARPAAGDSGVRWPGSAHAVELPFQLVSNKPFIDVRVNGSRPLNFLFDTGSPSTVVAAERAGALGLATHGSRPEEGAGEASSERGFVGAVSVALGGLELARLEATTLPLANIAMAEGHALEGLVGFDVASRFVETLDYAARRMRIASPSAYTPRGGTALPYTILGDGLMVIHATVVQPGGRPIEGRFVVDTGVRSTLIFNGPFAERRLHAAGPRAPQGAIGYGIGGESRGRLIRLAAIRLGGITVRQPWAAISTDAKGIFTSADFDGIIGGALLRRFTVTFDHPRRRIVLEPNAEFERPFEYDMSGAFVLADGPDYRSYRIWRVLPDTPAAVVGIREGDRVIALDGRLASELTLDQLRERLMAPGRTVRLTIERDGTRREIALPLRRLI